MKYLTLPLIALALLLQACGTTATRKDASGNEGITKVHGLDFKDYQIAAEDLINKLLATRRLNPDGQGTPPVIMVSEFKNTTSEHLDTQLLTQKITIALDKSNQARTTTTAYRKSEFDPAVRDSRTFKDDPVFDPDTVQKNRTAISPDYSLAGEITELKRSEGRKRESYYQIYLTVTDLKTGLAVWQDAKEILKQDKKPLIGF